MAYNTKQIVTDKDGNPISQYFNPSTDKYEAVEGNKGANKVTLYNADGSENTGLSLLPILDKLSQLTGTVIDEETRKDNELQRIALYNQISQMLVDGELKGDTGDTGLGLEFNWLGTQLGVRVEGDAEYVYVDLRGPEGPQGPAGTIENLESQHIIDALGYTPANELDLTKLEHSELTSVATNMDSEGVYQNIEWKRKDNTLYAKSTLIGSTPNYNQIKMDYYDESGTSIIKTIMWDILYDDNDFPYQRTVI